MLVPRAAEKHRFISAGCRLGKKKSFIKPKVEVQRWGEQLAGIDDHASPFDSEIEVSIFGPGLGECIVAHLGFSDWIIVDSCVRPDAKTPVGIEYLKRIGVATSRVKLVIATHWHDDHMRGLGETFRQCQNAKFACSVALKGNEWTTLVETYRNCISSAGSGLDEMRKVMQELDRRAKNKEVVAPKFAISNFPLFQRDSPLPACVTALSPSDGAVASFQANILSRLQPTPSKRRLRVPEMGPNDGSVVLNLRVGSSFILLGADLEERNRPGLGWQVILDKHGSSQSSFERLQGASSAARRMAIMMDNGSAF